MRTALFTYDGLHRKSSRFFVRLVAAGDCPQVVVAAPWKDLGPQRRGVRTRPRGLGAVELRALCSELDVEYVVVDHDSSEAPGVLHDRGIEFGVIGGARILREPVLSAVPFGILNVHPGMLPEIRGLDALKWSILDKVPPGVSAHLVDDRVDVGRLVHQEVLPVYSDETLPEIGLRLDELQELVLTRALERLGQATAASDFPHVEPSGPNRGRMDKETEAEMRRVFPSWLQRMAARGQDGASD